MGVGMLLKVFSDCCICFAILGAFPSVIPYSYPLLWPALLCGLAAGLAAFLREKGQRVLSCLCVILPFASLLFIGERMEVLILIPVLLYTALVILRGRLQLEYYSYRQFFKRTIFLLGGLFLALSAFHFLEGLSGEEELLIHAEVTLRYTVVHLLCGVILQRQLRLGMENRGRGGAGQIAAMLGGTGVVIFGFLVAEPLLRKGASVVLKTVISAIFGVAMAGLDIFNSALDKVEIGQMNQQVQDAKNDRLPAQSTALHDMIQQNVEQEEVTRSLWWVVLVVAVLLIAMGLMFFTFRKKGGAVYSEETVAKVAVPNKGKTEPRRSNRSKIRQTYREFLRQERKRGLVLKKDYTSEDILQRVSEDTNEDAAAELRALYIYARYNETGEVTREQVEAAKTALKRARGGTAEG